MSIANRRLEAYTSLGEVYPIPDSPTTLFYYSLVLSYYMKRVLCTCYHLVITRWDGKTFEASGPVALRILEDIRYYVEVPDTNSAEYADCANKSGKVSSLQHNIGKPGRDA